MLTDFETVEAIRHAKVIAVVGMADGSKPDRPAFYVPERLQLMGYQIIPVNPMIQSALGVPALASVKDLPSGVDILNVFRRPEAIPELTEELLALPKAQRPAVVWLQTGITHPGSQAKLEQAGYRVVADRCSAVYAARARARN